MFHQQNVSNVKKIWLDYLVALVFGSKELVGVKIRKGINETLGKNSIRFEFGFGGNSFVSSFLFSQ